MFMSVCAVAGAIVAVRFLEPFVDGLTIAFGNGSVVPAAADVFLAPWGRLLDTTNRVAAVAFFLIVVSGIPLALLAVIVKNSPAVVPSLVRSKIAVRISLALQLMNLGLGAVLMLTAALNEREIALTMMLVGVVYFVVNFVAVRVWRDRLLTIDSGMAARTVTSP